MTSKEALECIVVDLVPLAKEHNKEEIEQVEKDLEILEILKRKYVDIGKLTWADREDYNKDESDTDFMLTTEEYQKIKEWLKDESN